jgi:hypothetical protein
MRLNDFLIEAKTEEGEELEKAFGQALLKVFNPAYLPKIKKNISKDIKIKKKDFKNPNAVAYTKGRTIYVNEPIFEKLDMKDKVKYLLHEFIHIMQNTSNFVVIRAFKEIFNLADKLYPIVKKNITKPLPFFLTGKNQSLGTNPKYIKYEIISYLMNGDIRWDAISKKGYLEFMDVLRKSRVFNLNSDFWVKRIKKK